MAAKGLVLNTGPIGLSDLKDGQKISYNIESHKGKISAIDIKLI